MSLAAVEQARVHLTFPKDSVFLEAQQPAKASVLVKLRPQAQLAPANVPAISNMVASAVEGLAPDAVSVLDMNGNLLSRPKATERWMALEPPMASLDYRRRWRPTCWPRSTRRSIRCWAPTSSARGFRWSAISAGGGTERRSLRPGAQRDGEFAAHRGQPRDRRASGVPGTPSTLPHPAREARRCGIQPCHAHDGEHHLPDHAHGEEDASSGGRRARRSRWRCWWINELTWQQEKTGFKRVLVPPTPEKLKVIHDLVAGITGFNAERGDQLLVETLPFENTLTVEPPEVPQSPRAGKPQGPMHLAAGPQYLADWRRRGRFRRLRAGFLAADDAAERQAQSDRIYGESSAAGRGWARGRRTGEDSGPSIEKQLETKLAERDAMQAQLEAQALKSLQIAPVITKTAEILAKHLAREDQPRSGGFGAGAAHVD